MAATALSKRQIESISEGVNLGRKSNGTGTIEEVVNGIVLSSGTISNQATLDLSINSWYQNYDLFVFELINLVAATNNVDFYLRVSPDNTNFDSGASAYRFVMNLATDASVNSAVADTSDPQIIMNGTTGKIGNDTTRPFNATVKLFNPGSAAAFPMVQFIAAYYSQTANNNLCVANGTGARQTAQVTRAIRFLFSSGNISSGKYKIIGYKNS